MYEEFSFDGESPEWTAAFLWSCAGQWTVEDAEARADAAVDLVAKRRVAAQKARSEDNERRAAEYQRSLAVAVETVRGVGAYVDISTAALYDVTDFHTTHAVLTKRNDHAGTYLRVPLAALVDASLLAAEHGLVAAPEKQRADIVTKIRAAGILGCSAEDVTLIWDGGSECEPPQPEKILDVEIRGSFRPTRATWQKLAAAGLPIYAYAYDSAAVSWGDR